MTDESCASHLAKLIFLALLIGAAATYARGQESSSRPAKHVDKTSQPSDSQATSPSSDAVPLNGGFSYIIGPGDQLAINVLHEPDVSQKVQVRMDGKISMPLIGEIQAGGMMPASLQATIAQKLHDYIKDAEVTVVVEEVKSRQFSVMGEVEHPGSFPLVRPTRVLEGLAQAGGFRDFARVTKIRILRRNEQGETVTLPFNYKVVSKGKNDSQNIELQAGDTIVVP